MRLPHLLAAHMNMLRMSLVLFGAVIIASAVYFTGTQPNIAYAQCESYDDIYNVSYTTLCGVIVDGYGATGSGCVTIATVTYWGSVATIDDDSNTCVDQVSLGAFIEVLPSSITRGSSADLTWGSTGATSCSIDQGIGSVTPNTAGSQAVSPQTTTTYTITCQGELGQTVSDSATLTVAEPVLPTVALTANPTTISSDDSSTLSWSSSNATSCVIDNGVGAVTPNVSGTSPVAPDQTTTYTLTCTGPGGSRSAYASITVYDNDPDLTAGSVSATNASLGAVGSLSAPIQNIGTQQAGPSSAYYQVLAPNSKGNASNVLSVGALAAGASQTVTTSYTFSYEGMYEVRFCADWYGAVDESNEGNNCGPWAEIEVTDTGPSFNTVQCSVSDTQINVGETVTYTASGNGSARAPYTWSAPDSPSTNFGSGTVVHRTFTAADTYAMEVSATDADNNPAQCQPVVVGAAACPPGNEEVSISASPLRVRAGQTSTVSWNASGISGASADCTVSGPGISWTQTVSAPPQCSVSDSATVTINNQSTYTLSCDNAEPVSVTVNVIPNFEEF